MPCSWQRPVVHPLLSEGSVHLWCVSLDLSAERVESLKVLLNERERARSSRLRLPLLRERSVVTQATLHLLLGRYLGLPPEAVALTTGPHGKPSLGEAAELRFNLTHSGGLAVYALTLGREVGIDIEQVRPTPYALSVAQRYWTKEEAQALEAYAAGEGKTLEAGFLTYWTRKEAWLKAIGTGLHRPMDSFQVSGPDTPPPRSGGGGRGGGSSTVGGGELPASPRVTRNVWSGGGATGDRVRHFRTARSCTIIWQNG
ncbi:4'-phosphopantetheinyl transferase [Gammaproteobacteria bacterium]